MNLTANLDEFRRRAAKFAPVEELPARTLAMYSAAIATADRLSQENLIDAARVAGIERGVLYEVVLQSYLFLGFPRMLLAAEVLENLYKSKEPPEPVSAVTPEEAEDWYRRGLELCRHVYDGNYERLKNRVEALAPDVFRWMILEGYGKVLSRPGLDIVKRELAIVACLMMENRPAQLHSHMRGALNVGAETRLIRLVVEDVGRAAGEGYGAACGICTRLEIA